MATTGYANSVVSQATERLQTVEEVLSEVVGALDSAIKRLEEMESTVGPAREQAPPPVGIIGMSAAAHGLAVGLNERLARLAERLGRL